MQDISCGTLTVSRRCSDFPDLAARSRSLAIWQPPLPATIFEGPSIFCLLVLLGWSALNVSLNYLGGIIGADDDGGTEAAKRIR